MIRRPPRSTRTDTLFPYTTLFRSSEHRDPFAPMLETITDRAIAQHAIAHRGHMIALVKLGEAGLDARCQNDAAGGDDFAVLQRRAEMIAPRSDERRVGKECVSTCRSRGSPSH